MPETFFRPGVAVPEVSKNSPAAYAGLRKGDIILKVQNMDVPANPAAVPGVVRYITCDPPPQYVTLRAVLHAARRHRRRPGT